MNRKVMRKSTLISSIAMLLVAVLALSGVTFAWFTSDASATAGTLTMNSSTVAGLYITETLGSDQKPTAWGSHLNWSPKQGEQGVFLKPVTCGFNQITGEVEGQTVVTGINTAFFTTTSENPDGLWNKGTAVETAPESSYVKKTIYIKADASGMDLVLEIAFDGAQERGYQRCVIVDKNANKAYVFAGEARDKYSAFTSTAAAGEEPSKAEVTPIQEGKHTLIKQYDGKERTFEVYFYFEGQDTDCKNALSYANVTVDLTFKLEGTPTVTETPSSSEETPAG